MTDRARARARLATFAAVYAFGGGISLCVAALLPESVVPVERIPIALDVYLAGLAPAAAVIGWYKGRDAQSAP